MFSMVEKLRRPYFGQIMDLGFSKFFFLFNFLSSMAKRALATQQPCFIESVGLVCFFFV
jgi:hypothetical protein